MSGLRGGAGERRFSTKSRDTLLDETTPLLLTRTTSQETSGIENIAVITPEIKIIDEGDEDSATKWPYSARYMVYLCSFLTSLSFGVTQVP